MSLSDPTVAAEIRDVIAEIARSETNKISPPDRYAEIQTLDLLQKKATVTYPGETTAVPVAMSSIQPVGAGAIVRIAGSPGDRYIQDVVSGATIVQSTELYLERSGAVAGRITVEGGTGFNDWILEPNGGDFRITSSGGPSIQFDGTSGLLEVPSGWLGLNRTKITSTQDPTTAGTLHAFDIGGATDGSGLRMKMGPTTIQAVNGTSGSSLNLNPGGGSIFFGSLDVTKVALGRLASTTVASNSAGFTTTIYPASVSAATAPNRKIRVRVHTNVQSATAGCGISIGVANNVGTILTQAYRACSTANAAEQISVDYETTSGAGGTMTFQISAFASGGTGILIAAASALTHISIIDEGAI